MAEDEESQPRPGAFLAWEDLTVAVACSGSRKPARKLIKGLSGYALPGRLLAVMGPSGSGKSTLLDALAGRLARNVVLSGTVLVNGTKRKLYYGAVAYVTQENVLLGTLTVRETITCSAHLRLPRSMSKEEVSGIVESTVEEMGLEDCADRAIGNWHLRGISGGEKKRLCIALEILTRPPLLFLDEPTSGLDSAAAFFIIQTLRQMNYNGQKTVIASIHQPSSEVFALFDDLCLLSGGETVYFGDAKQATEFFAEARLPCPRRRNPSDHFLRCINSDFDHVNATLQGSFRLVAASQERETSSDPLLKLGTAEIKEMLIDKYKSSYYAVMAMKKIQEISKIKGNTLEPNKGSLAGWRKQLKILTHRSFINMSRDIGYYWLRIAIYIIVSLCVGSIYFDVGTSYTAILARASCGSFVTGFMSFMSIGGFPSFVEEMKVFYHERKNGHYGVAVYSISNFLSSFPFLLAVSLATASITFFMVKFGRDFSQYVYFTVSIYVGISVVESIMMIVSSLVPNFLMGIITGAGVLGIMMMTSGFFRLIRDLPKAIWRYPISYINYGAWLLQGNYKNVFMGINFDPLVPGDSKLSGEYVLQDMFGINWRYSKWLDMMAAFVALLIYRILFFLILKFKEMFSPFIWKNYAEFMNIRPWRKQSLKARKTTLSKHASQQPMALQEGLSSPLP